MAGALNTLYEVLGVARGASDAEIRRAARTLKTKHHPDRGGDAEAFTAVVEAAAVLSDPQKRSLYDATGRVEKTVGEAFVEQFGGGAFASSRASSRGASAAAAGASSMTDQIALVADGGQAGQAQSHTAGFEAWMRTRGAAPGVVDADVIAERFGVVPSSYQPVPLAPRRGGALAAVCSGAGRPADVLRLEAQGLPAELEWGQVLVEPLLAPISPADVYSVSLGGLYDEQAAQPPFVAGHDGVLRVAQVGPGVKDLAEGDVCLPVGPLMGTWAEARVVKAKGVVRVGKLAAGAGSAGGATPGPEAATLVDELPLPLEYLAAYRELLLAYRLLEQESGRLRPGDCVVLNAPSSTVGRALLQLCRLLKLRAVAVLRRGAAAGSEARWAAVAGQLSALGATLVLPDEGSVRAALQGERFFARPKLALDAVGGESAARLADALEAGGRLVSYGCLSGKATAWPWQAWVFRDLQVSGFNLRRWLAADTPAGAARLRGALEALGRLVGAGLLSLSFAEYGLEELHEAVEHAVEAPGGSRVLLRVGGGG